MSSIIDVKKTVIAFLIENIASSGITVIKIEKVKDSWNTVAELYEEDSFLKSMNLPSKKMRLFYSVTLDDNLEITSYERLSSFAGTDGSEK